MDKPSELVFSCVTGQNKTITAKFGMVIDSLTHACKAIGEPGKVRAKWPYPATIETDKYEEHGPYFVWKVGYRPPTQKRLALASNEKKSDAETPHIIATYNCDLLDVVTEDLINGKYEYCKREWVEI
ncbi:putative secreted effector protein [Blumeria graminis f. sp. tritici 96224]|nr:putative secreted effector protein [Blumeria graminis f. sp. tritici 96224]